MHEKIYNEGHDAYFEGKSKQDNPYEYGIQNYNLWLQGFKSGEKKDIEQDPDGN